MTNYPSKIISVILAGLALCAYSSNAQSVSETVISTFNGFPDGAYPDGDLLAIGNDTFVGTTFAGGNDGTCILGGGYSGCGTVYMLKKTGTNHWSRTTIFNFNGYTNGSGPLGNLIKDAAGNLYGTTSEGGPSPCAYGCGTVYKLSPPSRLGGSWTQTVLYTFRGGVQYQGSDGQTPSAGLYMDGQGNLFGTTLYGGKNWCYPGYGCGAVFELSPGQNGSWMEKVLYSFKGGADGASPLAPLTGSSNGTLYGTSSGEWSADHQWTGPGTVFSLTPGQADWHETILHTFLKGNGSDGYYPVAGLYRDASGNLFGTTQQGGTQDVGTVFELSPQGVIWKETILHHFTTDGSYPQARLTAGGDGTLYGTALAGGTGIGTVFSLKKTQGIWSENTIYNFQTGPGGVEPETAVTVLPTGEIFGTTSSDGGDCHCGTLYELK